MVDLVADLNADLTDDLTTGLTDSLTDDLTQRGLYNDNDIYSKVLYISGLVIK